MSTLKPNLLNTAADRTILPGMASFTRLGYELRAWRWEALPRMDGRTVVITGATSGLGKAAAEQIAALGARVVIVARDTAKAERTIAEIAAVTGNDDLGFYLADLSEMEEVRRVASQLLEAEPEIHVLVNNVGVLFPERAESAEGVELTLATNLLSGFLLTNLVLERLRASAPARIINVSSGGMYTQGISLSNLQYTRGEYDGSKAYARTKRGQVILTEMWAELLDGSGVTANAMHPGWADTPGLNASLPGFRRLVKPLLRSPAQGADTIAWLAAAHEMTWTSGNFYLDRAPHITNVLPGTDLDADQRRAFWQRLTELTGLEGHPPPAQNG